MRRWAAPGCYFERFTCLAEEFRCTFERFPLEVPEARLPPTHKYLGRLGARGVVVR
jgi:hypothetical protein